MQESNRKIYLAGALLLLAAVAAVFLFLTGANSRSYTTTQFLMDTFVELRLYGRGAQQAAQEVVSVLRSYEQSVSCHLDGSSVSRLNDQAGGEPVEMEPTLLELLARCKEISKAYSGCFDVTIGPVVQLWGITSSHPQVPDAASLNAALQLVDYRDLELDEAAHTARLRRSGQQVDLGGIAKGAACGMIREILERHGVKNGYVSLGGNLLVLGKNPQTGEDFRFGLRDPFGEADEMFGAVVIPGRTMATAGGYERYFEQDGVRYHHILNPSTGAPAESDLVSVTVISEDGALADALSTAFFVGGSALLLEHLEEPEYDVIAVGKERQVYCSPRIREQFVLQEEKGFKLVN